LRAWAESVMLLRGHHAAGVHRLWRVLYCRGLFVRNPIILVLVLYGWEWINFLLPPLLKKISVIHYLNSLVPVPISEGPFAVVAQPTPAWISIPGLLIVTALVLFAAGTRIRRMEVRYGRD